MTVKIHDLCAIRPPGGPPGGTLMANSLFFSGPPNVALVPQAMAPSGGVLPYGFSAVGLPAGVVIDAVTGIISGTPTATGNTTATITVTDSAGTPQSINVPVFFDIALAPDVTSFSDTLVAPDQPFLTGDAYYCCQTAQGTLTGSMDSMASRIGRQATGLQIAGGGGGNIVTFGSFIPRPLSFVNVAGKNQFAEVKIVSDTSAGANVVVGGISVYVQTNNGQKYSLRKNPAGVAAGVGLVVSFPGTNTLISAVHAVVANDVVRLEVTTAGGNNTLKILINGIVVQTVVNAAITAQGMPAIDVASLGVGAQVLTLRDFSCGVL